jgi:FlaA1/EpsC-like NDP-sugar epimerase
MHGPTSVGIALTTLRTRCESVYDPRRTCKAVDEIQNNVSRPLFVVFAVLGLIALLAWRVLVRFFFRLLSGWAYPPRRVLVVGTGEVGQRVAHMVREHAWAGLHLAGYLDDVIFRSMVDDAEKLQAQVNHVDGEGHLR